MGVNQMAAGVSVGVVSGLRMGERRGSRRLWVLFICLLAQLSGQSRGRVLGGLRWLGGCVNYWLVMFVVGGCWLVERGVGVGVRSWARLRCWLIRGLGGVPVALVGGEDFVRWESFGEVVDSSLCVSSVETSEDVGPAPALVSVADVEAAVVGSSVPVEEVLFRRQRGGKFTPVKRRRRGEVLFRRVVGVGGVVEFVEVELGSKREGRCVVK